MAGGALTGHRPERLGYAKDTYETIDWERMVDWLKFKIKENNITDAYCGMADGCDIAYGIAALRLKEEGIWLYGADIDGKDISYNSGWKITPI